MLQETVSALIEALLDYTGGIFGCQPRRTSHHGRFVIRSGSLEKAQCGSQKVTFRTINSSVYSRVLIKNDCCGLRFIVLASVISWMTAFANVCVLELALRQA